MLVIDEELIAQAVRGELPDELTQTDLASRLTEGWFDSLEPLDLVEENLDVLEDKIDLWVDDDSDFFAEHQVWWSGLQRACGSPSRFLFMMPLGERNYGRGDMDTESVYSLFFEIPNHVVKVTVFAFQPMGHGGDYEAPKEFAVMMSDAMNGWREETGKKFPYKVAPTRSFTAFHWKYLYAAGKDDPRMTRYFELPRTCGAWEMEGFKKSEYEPGPPPGQRGDLRETRWDLVQLQGVALARAALQVGAATMNSRQAEVNGELDRLKAGFGSFLTKATNYYQARLLTIDE